MLVIFNDGNRRVAIHLDLPPDEIDEVMLISKLQHGRTWEASANAHLAWAGWYAAAPDNAARERRLAVGQAMALLPFA
jgi:hypothetical protein